jgi:hypothetical protein
MYIIVAERRPVGWIMPVDSKILQPGIELVQSSTPGPDPDDLGLQRRLGQGQDHVGTDAVCITGMAAVMDERMSIEPIQTVFSSKPHESCLILKDTIHRILTESIQAGQPVKMNRTGIGSHLER